MEYHDSFLRALIGPTDPLSPNNKCEQNQRPAIMEATMKDILSFIWKDTVFAKGDSVAMYLEVCMPK